MKKDSVNYNSDSDHVLHELVRDYLQEKQRQRRNRWIKRILILSILCIIGVTAWYNSKTCIDAHVGLIDIKGPIGDGQVSSGDLLMKEMGQAYRNHESLKAVILRIDSPGGSPVQADYMYQAVRYYKNKYPNIKTYAVCVDLCASAAYYVASAADEIYANPSSLVGSIGVIYNGFGLVDTLHKIGVESRLQTAGSNKGFMDPFSPMQEAQKQHLQSMLDNIHQQFIARVKEGRGKRLKIDNLTFSGLIWTGVQAKERGLIDDFASSGFIAREILKTPKIIDYTEKPNMFEQMMQNFGTSMSNQLTLFLTSNKLW